MKAYLSRRYRFSASHRLHSESFTAEQNRTIFGKCNNPFGHGHNYVVQVTMSGQVDPATGMVCNLAELDAFAQINLLSLFDHANLNTLTIFEAIVPSTENLARVIYQIFRDFPAAHLENIHVEETNNNFFDYDGDRDTYIGSRL
ncbi:6-carboxytetrahydropterin synthase [Granulicella arctica]|uniref:6-carboxy-5,6,7,8-tetrahydropterin synthase n=1 Tax=Granulicella arctica TaxID=940613 RepID=A0A7Y9PJM4_9BACT|nr:6-carboxytetrahydropterin synthase [Granulicella arctica]NYF80984.1 6-pyruvoyltetrahydropterin/6-carboxytetrahydropterin synthase [Granulicella arctica]